MASSPSDILGWRPRLPEDLEHDFKVGKDEEEEQDAEEDIARYPSSS
jgi:hypothetical protein